MERGPKEKATKLESIYKQLITEAQLNPKAIILLFGKKELRELIARLATGQTPPPMPVAGRVREKFRNRSGRIPNSHFIDPRLETVANLYGKTKYTTLVNAVSRLLEDIQKHHKDILVASELITGWDKMLFVSQNYSIIRNVYKLAGKPDDVQFQEFLATHSERFDEVDYQIWVRYFRLGHPKPPKFSLNEIVTNLRQSDSQLTKFNQTDLRNRLAKFSRHFGCVALQGSTKKLFAHQVYWVIQKHSRQPADQFQAQAVHSDSKTE
jgi:hypothetical protein